MKRNISKNREYKAYTPSKSIAKIMATAVLMTFILSFASCKDNADDGKDNKDSTDYSGNPKTEKILNQVPYLIKKAPPVACLDSLSCNTFYKELDESTFKNRLTSAEYQGGQLGYDGVNYSYELYTFIGGDRVQKIEIYVDKTVQSEVADPMAMWRLKSASESKAICQTSPANQMVYIMNDCLEKNPQYSYTFPDGHVEIGVPIGCRREDGTVGPVHTSINRRPDITVDGQVISSTPIYNVNCSTNNDTDFDLGIPLPARLVEGKDDLRISIKEGGYKIVGDDLQISYETQEQNGSNSVSPDNFSKSKVFGFSKKQIVEKETIKKDLLSQGYRDYIKDFQDAIKKKDAVKVSKMYQFTTFVTHAHFGKDFGRSSMQSVATKGNIQVNSNNGGKLILKAWAIHFDDTFLPYFSPDIKYNTETQMAPGFGLGGALFYFDNFKPFPKHIINGAYMGNEKNMASYQHDLVSDIDGVKFTVSYGGGRDVKVEGGVIPQTSTKPQIIWQDGSKSDLAVDKLGW